MHYGFVWRRRPAHPPPDAGKDRPGLIVRLREGQASGGRVVRVTYLPISHVAPRGDERAMPVPTRVARHLGLSGEQSHLYLSYAVEDDWPFDLAHLPGPLRRFDYGFVPPKYFEAVAADFAAYLASHPGTTHRR